MESVCILCDTSEPLNSSGVCAICSDDIHPDIESLLFLLSRFDFALHAARRYAGLPVGIPMFNEVKP